MKSSLLCASALAAALTLSSCTTRLMELSVAGSKNVKLEDASQYTASHNVPTKGTHRSHIILFFPIGAPNIDNALTDALEKAGPNAVALYNVTLDETNWWIPCLYGQKIYTIKGDPVFNGTAPVTAPEGTPAPAPAAEEETPTEQVTE